MIVKSWKFTGFKATFPEWVQENTSKRKGSEKLWVHTQAGEAPAEEGDYIKVNNTSDIEQLSYLRIFDSEGARS